MDINDLRSLATVMCFIALAGVFYWAWHPKRKDRFEQDAQLIFGDDIVDSTDNQKREGENNK